MNKFVCRCGHRICRDELDHHVYRKNTNQYSIKWVCRNCGLSGRHGFTNDTYGIVLGASASSIFHLICDICFVHDAYDSREQIQLEKLPPITELELNNTNYTIPKNLNIRR
jgi:hypothetical protein